MQRRQHIFLLIVLRAEIFHAPAPHRARSASCGSLRLAAANVATGIAVTPLLCVKSGAFQITAASNEKCPAVGMMLTSRSPCRNGC